MTCDVWRVTCDVWQAHHIGRNGQRPAARLTRRREEELERALRILRTREI